MARRGSRSKASAGFARAAYRHFQSFLATRGRPLGVLTVVTLAAGDTFSCHGFWVDHVGEVPGCVMVHGVPALAERAIVVREDHIISVMLEIEPPPSGGEDVAVFGSAAYKNRKA